MFIGRNDTMNEIEPKERKGYNIRTATKDIVYTAMFSALICICSIISIPIGDVPITLQTLAVCISAAMLGWKRGTISVIVYILLGAVGLPVFAGMSGGFGVIAGSTGGYIVGFILTALIVGFAADKFGRKIIPLSVSMVIGILACYAVGTPWFMMVTGMDLWVSLGYCVFPFLIPDAVKVAIAVILTERLSKVIKL